MTDEHKVHDKDIRTFQLNKINGILKYVLNNNSFYKKFYTEHGITDEFSISDLRQLQQLPILSKPIFRKVSQEDVFISKPFSKKELESHKTTGSTGNPSIIYSDAYSSQKKGETLSALWNKIGNRSYLRELRLWRKKEFDGIDKIRADAGLLYNLDVFEIEGSVSQNENYFKTQADKVYSYDPHIIRGYVSALYSFGQHIDASKLKSLKCVIASAESLPPKLWDVLEEYYQVPVINIYGGTEATALAISSRVSRKMRISENLYFIEIVDESGQPTASGHPGRILVTDLNAKAFPLIRYEIGDIAIAEKDFFELPDYYRSFSSVEGRTNDIFRLVDGQVLYSHFWQNYFRDKSFVKRFQVIQETESFISIKLQVEADDQTAINRESILGELKTYLPSINCEVDFVKDFQLGAGGKFSPLISKVKIDFNSLNK